MRAMREAVRSEDADCPGCGAYFCSMKRVAAYGLTLLVLTSVVVLPTL